MLEFLQDLWGFTRERKKFWMAPIIIILVLLPISYFTNVILLESVILVIVSSASSFTLPYRTILEINTNIKMILIIRTYILFLN